MATRIVHYVSYEGNNRRYEVEAPADATDDEVRWLALQEDLGPGDGIHIITYIE